MVDAELCQLICITTIYSENYVFQWLCNHLSSHPPDTSAKYTLTMSTHFRPWKDNAPRKRQQHNVHIHTPTHLHTDNITSSLVITLFALFIPCTLCARINAPAERSRRLQSTLNSTSADENAKAYSPSPPGSNRYPSHPARSIRQFITCEFRCTRSQPAQRRWH